MARAGRPASESYMPVCYSGSQSLSFSSDAGTAGTEDEDDRAPIFSLSKSSMDVVMATGLPHKRDPAWNITDLKRSSSTNTPSEQTSLSHKPLHPHMWQHFKPTNSHQLSLSAQNMEAHNPPAAVSERIINMQRWSQCSGSTHSRSSTPDTIVWKGGTSRPSSLTQEAPYSPAPESPVPTPTTISPLISPLQTPTLPPEDLLTTSSSFLILNTHKRNELLVSSSPLPSPLLPPLQPHTSSPLPSNSPNLNQRTSTDDEGFLENNLLSFTFPSPIPSSVSLAEGGASSDPGSLVDEVTEKLHSPGSMQLSESGEVRSPVQSSGCPVQTMLNSPAKRQESGESGVCYLKLPWQLEQSCATGRSWKSPLVSSLSDSQLGDCRKCNLNTRGGINEVEMLREEGTMTSRLELVDAAVQTITPVGSVWGLRMNASNSNMGSHSILGSPPGSRLNLKSSVGSNSNLVSPSSSMFPVSSGEEEERRGETWNSPQEPDSRRSCLKIHGEDRDELGRRSSMKQVQWDEDGMTWDIHGASLDPEILSTAILKHLEVQNSPQPARRTSKKKKAPKPPVISNMVKAMTPELNPPASTCVAEAESKETPDEGWEKVEEGKKEETVEAARRISRAEADTAKEDDEVYGEEATSSPKTPSRESAHGRKKSVIRSFRRPGWCGASKKAND